MIATLSTAMRCGLQRVRRLVADTFGRQQGHLTRVATHERAVWLWQVMNELTERTHQVVMEQAERTRCAVAGGDEWKAQELETLLRYLRKKDYFAAIRTGELDVPVLDTRHPLATDSNDTLHPRGAKNDNSICLRFNQRLYQLFNRRPALKILDLGCAGGGLVRTLIDDGHFAVGLEGSDYPRLNQCGEWGTISHHLLTCDITKPFNLTSGETGEPLQFDAITAWEVMEHIPENRIEELMSNVGRHLAPGGWVLQAISTVPDFDPVTKVAWHCTVRPREWWEATFARLGFFASGDHPFEPYDWLRGSGNGRYDWKPEDNMGTHVALRRSADKETGR